MPAHTSNSQQPEQPVDVVAPIYVTVKDGAAILGGGTSPWTINRLCRDGHIESRFMGRRRMVVLASLREYAANLPATREEASA